MSVPTLTGDTYKGDGESWEAYAHRLEKRIKQQRAQLDSAQALRKVPGDKQARQHIAALERALGRLTERWQRARDDRDAVVRQQEALLAVAEAASVLRWSALIMRGGAVYNIIRFSTDEQTVAWDALTDALAKLDARRKPS